MKKYLLLIILFLSALSISASAAFYSITGLSQLFAGAGVAVIIMASSLEVSKLVIASFLYQYWEKINKALKYYLSVALIVLMFITSAGIYGFLSGAFEKTASKDSLVEKQTMVLESKKSRFIETQANYIKEKERISNSTSELRKALSTGINNQYKDQATGQIINYTNNSNRKTFEKQLENSLKSEEILTSKIEILNDSIFKLETQIIEFKSNSDSTSELGPLKYLSKLTNNPMEKIVNWFLILIIFVFDPLAISLVIATNFVYNQINPKLPPPPIPNKEYTIYTPKEELKQEPQSNPEKEQLKNQLIELEKKLIPGMPSDPGTVWVREEINNIKNRLRKIDDEEIKTY